ncbi:MAG: AAA family ATPase [Candidatus Moraniibacteriota bacterium]
MSRYIKAVKLNLWNNTFICDVIFSNGLNVISGSNGTGKTKLLQFIQEHNNNSDHQVILDDNTYSTTISAFSPQRNAQKTLAQQAMQLFRGDINATQNTLNTFKNQLIQDDGFQTLKAISEYFVYSAEDETNRDGNTNKNDAAEITKNIFEKVIKKVFDFEIDFVFNSSNKSYDLIFKKDGVALKTTDLSHGENAVIVLMCALIFGKDSADTFLIDEPETHLNWSLEEKLFEFFDWYCSEYDKQIIAVTHSRVIFLDKYKDKRQFFERKGSVVQVSEKPSKELISQLAGDTVNLIEGITSQSKLVYVEDNSHKTILESIAKKLNINIDIQVCNGGCEKVKDISKAFKSLNVNNVYFLIDGDNKPLESDQKKLLHKNTIQLKKYCIENYLLDMGILNLYKAQDWDASIKANINSINVATKPGIKPVQIALEKNASLADIIDFLDGSEILKQIAKSESKKEYELIAEMISKIAAENLLGKYFMELSFLQDN